MRGDVVRGGVVRGGVVRGGVVRGEPKVRLEVSLQVTS